MLSSAQQVVPEQLLQLEQAEGNQEGKLRLWKALIGMSQLDMAALERAFRGPSS